MNKWYLVGVKYTKEFTDGTLKRVTEHYLLNANSYTDAEARIYTEVGEFVRGEFLVAHIKQKQYADIYQYDDTDIIWEVKVSYVSEDADSGKEKKINQKMLVFAHNAKEAYERMEECLKGIMITYEMPSINQSSIEEIFTGDGYQMNMDEAIRTEEAADA